MTKSVLPMAALGFAAMLAMAPAGARAEDAASSHQRYEAALDIDRDGTRDRAVLLRHSSGPSADLLIYLGLESESLDRSRRPDIRANDFAIGQVMGLEANSRGSLTVRYGCGGCSNDFETTVAIVHRGGELVVAGFSHNWETNESRGICDINFLTGKGVRSRGQSKPRSIAVRSIPVRLTEWSAESSSRLVSQACF